MAQETGLKVPATAWVAVAFAVVAAGSGAAFGYSASHNQSQLLSGYSQTLVYGGTRAQALAGKQDAVFADIAYAAAGVGLATAAVVTLLGQGGDAVQVAPAAGPTGAGVQVGGVF